MKEVTNRSLGPAPPPLCRAGSTARTSCLLSDVPPALLPPRGGSPGDPAGHPSNQICQATRQHAMERPPVLCWGKGVRGAQKKLFPGFVILATLIGIVGRTPCTECPDRAHRQMRREPALGRMRGRMGWMNRGYLEDQAPCSTTALPRAHFTEGATEAQRAFGLAQSHPGREGQGRAGSEPGPRCQLASS